MLPKKLHPNTPQPRWTFRLPMTIDPQKWNIILHYGYIDILKHIYLLHKQQLWYTINPVKIQSKNKDSRNIPMHTCAKKCVSLHNLKNEITASLITTSIKLAICSSTYQNTSFWIQYKMLKSQSICV